MNQDLIIDITKKVAIISIIIVVLVAIIFTNPKPIILGYFFGTLISVVSLKLMGNTINKAVQKTPSKASSYTRSHYMFRLTIYGLVLVVAAKADYLNFMSTAVGLTMVKNIIIFFTIFDKNFK